jgi:hypothetical protein
MTFESLGKEKGARRICGERKEARVQLWAV